MIENLLRYNFNQKFLVMDWETNGLNLTTTKPWQLGFILCQGKFVKEEFERKIWWPEYPMQPEIAAMNHFFRPQYEKEARDPAEVLDELESYLYDPEYIIIGQNLLGFDVYVHNTYRKILGRKTDYSYINRVIDTKALSMAIQKGAKNPPKEDFMSWQISWLNHRERGIKTSQAAMLKHYNIAHSAEGLHEALTDVKMSFEIFKRQIQEIEI